MERVLLAEQQAQVRLVETDAEAQALVEAARGLALARVNRARERIARWQRGHSVSMEQRLAALRDQADAEAKDHPVLGAQQIEAAAERVAALLTDASQGENE